MSILTSELTPENLFPEIWLQWYTEGIVMSRELFIGIYFVFAISAVAASLASFWYVTPFRTAVWGGGM